MSALRHSLEDGSLLDDPKLLIACDQERDLLTRPRPFAHVIREDSFERPLVVMAGSVYVTAGTTHRSTRTRYTPPSLTDQNAVEELKRRKRSGLLRPTFLGTHEKVLIQDEKVFMNSSYNFLSFTGRDGLRESGRFNEAVFQNCVRIH